MQGEGNTLSSSNEVAWQPSARYPDAAVQIIVKASPSGLEIAMAVPYGQVLRELLSI